MFDLNILLRTISVTEVESPNLFPFPFNLHVGFAIISLIFFAFRFFTSKKPFQLILAIAIPLSLTIWLSESKTWFYTVGVIELLMLIAAFVTSIIFRDKSADETAKSETDEKSSEKDEAVSDDNKDISEEQE